MEQLESWRWAWRNGVAPTVSTTGLEALAKALEENDPRLVQGVTIRTAPVSTDAPRPLPPYDQMPVSGACALGFCGWIGDDLPTAGQVDGYFASKTTEADQRLGAHRCVSSFLCWFDDNPREEVFRELLAEVEAELTRRKESA